MSAAALLTAVIWVLIVLAASPMLWLIIQPYARGWSRAERRAMGFLRELLTPDEYQQLSWLGYLDVHSPSISQRIYRVPRSRGYVQVYENGRAIMRLCVQPMDHLPDADVIIMHKLMIEGNEEHYLQKANKYFYRS
jgi:hypothetical protein